MLSSPTTVTINGTAHSLVKVNQDNYSSVFLKKAAGLEIKLQVRHQTESAKAGAIPVERHNVDLTHTTYDVNGVPTTMQAYVVLRMPRGADPALLEYDLAGLLTWVTANDTAVIAWDS